MDCRKNIWPIENTTIFTTVTAFWDANDVEEQPESVCSQQIRTHQSIIEDGKCIHAYVAKGLELHHQLNCLYIINFDMGNFSIPFSSSSLFRFLSLSPMSFVFHFRFRFYFAVSGLSLLAITLKSKSIWMTEHRNFDNCEKGCFVVGLSIEGAGWSIEQNTLVKSNNLQEPLPILHIIPMEQHKLQAQVCKNCVDFHH